MKIENKIKNQVLNKTFRKRHIPANKVDEANNNCNLIQFFFWWDNDKIDFINKKFCLRYENKYKIFEEGILCFYSGEWFFPLEAIMTFLKLDFQQAFYAMNYFILRVNKSDINDHIYKTYSDENNKLDVDSTTSNSNIDFQSFLDNDLLISTDAKTKEKALKRVYAYLNNTRRIHRDVISHFIKQRLITVDEKYNINFITYKDDNIIAVTRRSTNTYNKFQQNFVKEKNTGFIYKSKRAKLIKTIYVFESCIDLMSYLSLIVEKKVDIPNKESTCYISLNGANIKYISKVLSNHHNVQNIVMCLDNDSFGIKTTESYIKGSCYNITSFQPKLREMTLNTGFLVKDVNDYLIQSYKYKI